MPIHESNKRAKTGYNQCEQFALSVAHKFEAYV